MNINLKRKLRKIVSHDAIVKAKTKTSSSEEGRKWYIAKKHNKVIYYVREIDNQNGAVKWTSHRSKSMHFHTENGVHQFIHDYLNDRTDIYLIHAAEKRK